MSFRFSFGGVFIALIAFSFSSQAFDYTTNSGNPDCDVTLDNAKVAAEVETTHRVIRNGKQIYPVPTNSKQLTRADVSKVTLPLEMPLDSYANINNGNLDTSEMEIVPGTVEVDAENGEVTFNGKSITPSDCL